MGHHSGVVEEAGSHTGPHKADGVVDNHPCESGEEASGDHIHHVRSNRDEQVEENAPDSVLAGCSHAGGHACRNRRSVGNRLDALETENDKGRGLGGLPQIGSREW